MSPHHPFRPGLRLPSSRRLRGCLAAGLLAFALPLQANSEWPVDGAPAVDPLEAAPSQMPTAAQTVAAALYPVLVDLFLKQGGAAQTEAVAQGETLRAPAAPSSLGVEQVRTGPDGAHLQVPQGQVPDSAGLRIPAVRQGTTAEGLPEVPTSADCNSPQAGAECLLLKQPPQDGLTQTGTATDPLTGVPLLPGVSSPPPDGISPGVYQGLPRR